jgi:hypothetical protein
MYGGRSKESGYDARRCTEGSVPPTDPSMRDNCSKIFI